MSENSKIEWTDHTFNPWIGCQKVGPGCDHCYAESMMADRLKKVQWGPGAPRQRTSPANWKLPLAWNAAHAEFFAQHGRRQRVFCASLADVFDNAVPTTWRMDLFSLIAATPNLDWLLLTKRIGNVMKMCQGDGLMFDMLRHVWLGATFCNQEEWDRDADKLFATPAAVHFGSFEPLLGAIDLMQCPECGGGGATTGHYFSDTGTETCERCRGTGARTYLDLGWAIVGGESGPGARPKHPDWTRSLRDQCASAGLPFLLKQWGEWAPGENVKRRSGIVDTATWWNDQWVFGRENLASCDGHADDEPDLYRIGKREAGRLLDGVQHDGFPLIDVSPACGS